MAPVTVYSTLLCPYCHRAKALLAKKGVAFEEIDVMANPSRKPEMIERAGGRKTVPQIFIGDTHVGGSDDLHRLEAQGRLDPLLGAVS